MPRIGRHPRHGGVVPAIHAFSGAALEAAKRRSFLLPYKRQFMPVEDDFIRELGLDPEDEAWADEKYGFVKAYSSGARRNSVLRRLRLKSGNASGDI